PPARRAILNAASFASVPEFETNRADPSGRSRLWCSFSARPIWAGEVKEFERWPRVLACSAIAAVQGGRAWPRALLARPAARSRYFLPDASQTSEPSPRTRSSWGEPKTGDRTREKSSRQVCAWSPAWSFAAGSAGFVCACVSVMDVLRGCLVPVAQRCGFDDGVFDHGADALGGEDLEQQRMRHPPVDDVSLLHPVLDRLECGGHLRDHPRVEGGQEFAQLLRADA